MANVEYYERWLELKKNLQEAIIDDTRLQDLAYREVGIKPQGSAVEVVGRVYCKYCELYNKLCDIYDQMEQVQRRPYIRKLIDTLTCRILELKRTFEEVEVFEYTYPDNALQQLLMIPTDVQVLCPFFYPFEIREQENQYIIDQIFAGNRIGDPEPTPSELERREEERLERERILQEEKEAEIKRKLAMGEEIEESVASEHLSPEELKALQLQQEYETHVNNIQKMERSRCTVRQIIHKFNKDADLYLELAGIAKPQAREDIKLRATKFIQMMYRKFMEMKRIQERERRLHEKLGMVLPSYSPVSAKVQLENVKKERRLYRQQFYEKWLQENIKENSRVLRLREGDIMEDISTEIRAWLRDWYKAVKCFDEFPWPDEGGSILIVQGETMTIPEYIEWKSVEEKRLKAEASNPKTKEQIKQEKMAAKAEKKRLLADAKEKEKKKLADYKKQRLNPDNDPGVIVKIGLEFEHINQAWNVYQNQWKYIDLPNPLNDVIKGYIHELITENAYRDIQYQLRPIVDDMMRIEYNMLKNSLKEDLNRGGIKVLPITQKRKKPKKAKQPKPFPESTAFMLQELVDNGLVRTYPHKTLDEYWGDRNYGAADLRAVLWTPSFPPPCLGDVQEQIRLKCIMALGSDCTTAERTQLIVGPQGSGKKSLVYAIASETNSLLFDLNPLSMGDKYVGPKNQKRMFMLINRISRIMQPAIIYIEDAEKMFYKKVPPEEKRFEPTKLSKVLFKELIKPILPSDKILVLGTSSMPWLAKGASMNKVFPSVIMVPMSDYGSISYMLTTLLMKYHHMKRDFNVQSVAQVLRGYDPKSIISGIEAIVKKRQPELVYKPLEPVEVLHSVMDQPGVASIDAAEYDQLFTAWYHSYTPWGNKFVDNMLMLESQLVYKLKADKKKAQK